METVTNIKKGKYKTIKHVVEVTDNRVHKVKRWLSEHTVWSSIILALTLNLVIEMLGRRSFFGGIWAMLTNTFGFCYNSAIILTFLSFALLFKRRAFVTTLVSAIWLLLGLTDCILMVLRSTPFTATDVFNLVSGISVVPKYLKVWHMIIIVLGIAVIAVTLTIIFKRTPKKRVDYKKTLIFFGSTLISVFLVTMVGKLVAGNVCRDYSDIRDAYDKCGFAYCFTSSLLDRGIKEPDEYSTDTVEKIVDELDVENYSLPEFRPNIIMLQLESFFDMNNLYDAQYSENPVPVFESLKENYPSGYLTVPTVGAGTANTEFEVISGMALDFFGIGEYPYRTILQTNSCETACYDLKEVGYSTHAIHNNTGTFYDRDKVFSNLGFDTFTSLEYMQDVEYNPMMWAKDSVLTGEIEKALDSTEGSDFIYTISVQCHGSYPSGQISDNTIDVSETDNEAVAKFDTPGFEYYVNQAAEVDSFLGGLTEELSGWDEPVVLVMYGDHLPNFDLKNNDLKNGNIYQTEYVIWSNFEIDAGDRDLYSYQLMSYVMGLLGFDDGALVKLHQTESDSKSYMDDLKILEYDMLYGDWNVYNGINPYSPTELHMGTDDVCLDSAEVIDSSVYITGSGFTKWSQVSINGNYQDTTYINGNTLCVSLPETDSQTLSICVSQVTESGTVLSNANKYTLVLDQ